MHNEPSFEVSVGKLERSLKHLNHSTSDQRVNALRYHRRVPRLPPTRCVPRYRPIVNSSNLLTLPIDLARTKKASTNTSPDLPPTIMNSRPHKQSMSELKLRRLTEHNSRLREDLARPRVRVSDASARCVTCAFCHQSQIAFNSPRCMHSSLIRYCKTTKDHLV